MAEPESLVGAAGGVNTADRFQWTIRHGNRYN